MVVGFVRGSNHAQGASCLRASFRPVMRLCDPFPMPSISQQALWTCSDETREFFEVLTHDDRHSRYVVASNRNGQWSETSVYAEALGMNDYSSTEYSYYVTRNGFNGRRRESNRCRQINAMMFDLDCHAGNHQSILPTLIRRIVSLISEDAIPEPNLFVATGRGLQLYFVMERSTPYRVSGGKHNERGLEFFHDVERGLSALIEERVKDIPGVELDKSVYDLARVGRIPGSYNSKAHARCELINAHRRYYSLSDLKRYTAQTNGPVVKRQHRKRKHAPIGPDGHLLRSRKEALERLQKHRGSGCIGSRENMCFIYYNTATQLYGPDDAYALLAEFNAGFEKPLPESDMAQIKRTVDSVVIQYGKHKGETGFYPLSTTSISEKLHLTKQEIVELGFFTTRRSIKRKAARERTRQRREARDNRICELYAMGYKQKQVASMCGCSLRTVKAVTKREKIARGDLRETRKQQLEAYKEAQKHKSAKKRQTSWVVRDCSCSAGAAGASGVAPIGGASPFAFLGDFSTSGGSCFTSSPPPDVGRC